MKNRYLLLLLMVFFSAMGFAQQSSISGNVLDAVSNEPLVGVSVVVKGTTTGTVTDFNGSFVLETDPNAVLVFSLVGMQKQEVALKNRRIINVKMSENVQALDDVVVVGYGTQKKADLTSAISTLKPDEVLKMPGGVTDALQGSIAGVNVSAGKVRIRGVNTITGSSDPLWVVDGLIDGSVPNENEIESIQVLKDAASCAIYGMRGTNGVIIVTTKRGKKGDPMVEYNGYCGGGEPWNKIGMMNSTDYTTYVNELYYNYYGASSYQKNVPSTCLEPLRQQYDTDWQDAWFRKSFYQKHNVSVSAATDKMSYRAGATYSKNKNSTVESGSEYKGVYGNATFNKGIFRFGQNFQANLGKTKAGSGNFFDMLRSPSNLPIYDNTTSHGYFVTGKGDTGNDMVNQIARKYLIDTDTEDLSVKGNFYAEVDLLAKMFTYKFNLGYDIYRYNTKTFTPQYDLGKEVVDADKLSESNRRSRRMLYENTLNFQHTFARDHKVAAMVGFTSETVHSRSFGAQGEKDTESLLKVLDHYQSAPSINGSEYEDAIYSILGRVTYSYKDKYLLTANFRRDGSSNFSKDNRWGNFPSFSAGWRISEESFIKDNYSWISNLKLRATWGYIGNQSVVDRYSYQAYVESANLYYTFGGTQTSDDCNISAPLVLSFANADLGWETTRDAGVGLDIDLFDNRLNVVIDYYNRKTSDVIISQQLPLSSGTSNTVNINSGELTNSGLEISVNWRDKIGDFEYSISPNIAFNKNKVDDLGTMVFNAGELSGGGFATRTETGSKIGEFYGYKTDGIFKTQEEVDNHVNSQGIKIQPNAAPGDLKFQDKDDDGSLTESDKMYIGCPIPDYSLGITVGAAWKGFDFAMMWQGDFGNEIYNNGKTLICHGISPVNQMTTMNNRFRAEDVTLVTPEGDEIFLPKNTNTNIPRAVLNDPNGSMSKVSDYFVEDGSYFRCKRITLGYTLPKNILKKASISNLRIYCGVKNPFTFTDYSLFDPEVLGMDYADGGAQLNRGIDFQQSWGSTNAVTREYFAGIQLTF